MVDWRGALRDAGLALEALALMEHRPPLDDPSAWRPWPGSCDGCWAGCCHLPVDVERGDLVRLGWLDAAEARAPAAWIFLRLKARGLLQAVNVKADRFVLAQGEGGRCRLLGADARCTVYDRRPATCRAFPDVGPRPGCCPWDRGEQP